MPQDKSVASVRDICWNSIKTSTVRGVGRVASDRPVIIRFVWLLAILSFITLGFYNAINLVIDFYRAPIITKVDEKLVENMDFPAVTICNHSPLPSNAKDIIHDLGEDSEKKLPTLSRYFDIVKTFLKNGSEHDLLSYPIDSYMERLMTLHGYFQNIGEKNVRRVGHKRSTLLNQCDFKIAIFGLIGCENIANIQEVLMPNYFKCFTLTVNKTKLIPFLGLEGQKQDVITKQISKFKVRELHLISYLDNFFNERMTFFNKAQSAGQSSGVRITIHKPGTAPDTEMKGIDIPAGFSATLPVTVTERELLSHLCSKVTSEQYTVHNCMKICQQETIIQKCKCRDVEFYTDSTQAYGNDSMKNINGTDRLVPFCQVLTDKFQTLDDRLLCVETEKDMENMVAKKCSEKCPIPCRSTTYDPNLYLTQWPQQAYQLAFYKQYISNLDIEYLNHFSDFEKAEEIMDQNEEGGFEELDKIDSLSKNFIKTRIFYPEYHIRYVTDSHKYSMASFLGNFGGILNFYCGITVIVLVEILELLYNILLHLRDSRKLQPIKVVAQIDDGNKKI